MVKMVLINAKDIILGRLATTVAKNALLGESVDVINCEKAIITGNRKTILAKYHARRKRGIPTKGPFFPKRADMLVRRTIRGMLPFKRPKGREAYRRVKCYIGVPNEFHGKKAETIKHGNLSKLTTLKYITVEDLSKSLGAKI